MINIISVCIKPNFYLFNGANFLVTLSFFDFTKHKFWAFSMMGLGHSLLKEVSGLTFYKKLGTGREGFSIIPDFGQYGFLAVWESEEHANAFFSQSE